MLLGAEDWQKFVDIDEQLEQIDRFCIQYRVKQEGQERWLEATGERIDGEMLAGSVRDVTAAWNEQEQLRNRRLEFDLLNRYPERHRHHDLHTHLPAESFSGYSSEYHQQR